MRIRYGRRGKERSTVGDTVSNRFPDQAKKNAKEIKEKTLTRLEEARKNRR